jgi:hypothetical protein
MLTSPPGGDPSLGLDSGPLELTLAPGAAGDASPLREFYDEWFESEVETPPRLERDHAVLGGLALRLADEQTAAGPLLRWVTDSAGSGGAAWEARAQLPAVGADTDAYRRYERMALAILRWVGQSGSGPVEGAYPYPAP